MKRIAVWLLLVLMLILVSGCTAPFVWSEADFRIYDSEGREIGRIVENGENEIIRLSDFEGGQTYRGVKIGDRWENVVEAYDGAVEMYYFYGTEEGNIWHDEISYSELADRLGDAMARGDITEIITGSVYDKGEWKARSEVDLINAEHAEQYIFMFYIEDYVLSDVMIVYSSW